MDGKLLPALEDRIRRELPDLEADQIAELARILDRLVATLHPDRIYVFGSYARAEATPKSDIDLLIVVPQASQPAHRPAQTAYHALPAHSLAVDILVMPRDEFERRVPAVASLPATVLREGRMLYAA